MRKADFFVMSAIVMLAGCGGNGAPEANASNAPSDAPTTEAAIPAPSEAAAATSDTAPVMPPPVPMPPAPPASDIGAPPPAPPVSSLTPEAMKGVKGARAVLLTWARALENRQFGTAWDQFGNPPASRAAFTKWWQRYRTITVSVPTGEMEGAAGSSYYTAPAIVTGDTIEGKPFRLQGDVILRRVNDVDGATPAQLRWHIESADLKAAGS
ncbi:hypothetical protein GGR39_001017 [Novosphingobium fluoreni]|uniref:Lipoprotein n=1 Tax=Novosphingobium fluoreni TaxID=1391222 RepID=A0A7W6FYP7_9SPHN|nr:hypothetical protein [Novosphingobium fluoreni]MBB3939377.1 hypothetical protein [Novosphingobium fluoreni]